MVRGTENRAGSPGAARFGCLFTLAILAVSFYILTLFIRAEMNYRSARERIQEEAGQLHVDDRFEVRERLEPVIRELELPPAAGNVDVRSARGTRRFRLTVRYADTLRFLTWERVIRRTIEAETP